MKSVQVMILTRLEGGIFHPHTEGGDYSLKTPWRTPGMFFLEKEMKTVYSQNSSTDLPDVNPLIRAADWVRAKGQIRPISDVPVPEEQIGILFNLIRRRKKFTLEQLARKSGYEIEELIAFEAGLLPRLRMCEIFPDLARNVGFADKKLLQKLQSNISKTLNQ